MSENLASYEGNFYRISRNVAECTLCGSIIESKHIHDFVTCSCGNLSVDGGRDYIKRSAKDMTQVNELSENFRLSETDIKEYVKRVIHERRRNAPLFSDSYYSNAINAAKYYSTLWYGTNWKPDFTSQ
jgi:hypothetical protein